MPIVKNKSSKVRMVADRILQPGETREVSEKQAQAYEGDLDLEIVREAPKVESIYIATPGLIIPSEPEVKRKSKKGPWVPADSPPTEVKAKKTRKTKKRG